MLKDPRLTWKAKGILSYLLGQKNDWKVRPKDLANRSPGGIDAVYSALKELTTHGYAKLVENRDNEGRISSKDWIILDISLDLEKPGLAEPGLVKPHHSKNDDTSYRNKKQCGGNGSLHSPRFPSTNGFFENGGEEDPFINKAISKLEDHIRQERKINGRRINRKLWYEEFRLLLQDIENDKPRLKFVLMTFIKNEHPYRPVADCAASFRKKFLPIEDWAKRYAPPPPKDKIILEVTRHVVV